MHGDVMTKLWPQDMESVGDTSVFRVTDVSTLDDSH